jgi:hypothetical protein
MNMKKLTMIMAFGLCLFAAHAQEKNWTDLFNGKDLSGWKQLNGKAKYSVEDGEIVGTTVANTPNSFLVTEKTYGDFILELDLLVDSDMNSGIQIRSESTPDYKDGRVHGYQCEVDPSARAWSGGIYDEARRGWLYPLDMNPQGMTAFRNGRWNHYRIEAIGNSIRTWINGIPCADLVDDMTPKGFIALQVHGIHDPSQAGEEIRWKNIRIQTEDLVQSPWTTIPVVNLIPNNLSPEERAQGWQLLFDGKTTNGWRGERKEFFPTKGWKVENGELIVEGANGAESQNGGDIVTLDEYSTFELQLDFNITEGANSGVKYFITEKYGSSKSAIGLEYQILDDERHLDAKLGTDGNRTVASLYDLIPANKNKIVHKPGEWNHARIIVEGTRHEAWLSGSNKTAFTNFVGAHVEHWLNHRKVLQYERGTQAFYALVARSKYAHWDGFGGWQSGHILLQDHGNEVHFRSIKVRRLDPNEKP